MDINDEFCENFEDSENNLLDASNIAGVIRALESDASIKVPSKCKTSELYEMLAGQVDIVTLTNGQRFETENYKSGGPIVNEATITFYEMPIRPVKKTHYIQQDQIETDDNLIMSITGLTDGAGVYFSMQDNEKTSTRTEYFATRFQINYEMSLNSVLTTRSVYNLFTLLGDVGGLFGLLLSVAAWFSGILTFQKAENFLVKHMYAPGPDFNDGDEAGSEKGWSRGQSSMKEYLQASLPGFCLRGCLKETKRDKFYGKAREELVQELSLVEMLRSLRLINQVCKRELDCAQMKQTARLQILNEEDDSKIKNESQDDTNLAMEKSQRQLI